MSERAPGSHEQHKPVQHEQHKQQEAPKKSAEQSRHHHAERLDEIRKETESIAKSSKEIIRDEPAKSKKESHVPINRELKNIAYQRTLKHTQRQLPKTSRVFSKLIHQPAVEATSEFAGKTIARPSGILAGGIAAFLGSSIFLWIARHYGYEYNFLLFALLFIGGFFIGLLVELGLFAAARKQR